MPEIGGDRKRLVADEGRDQVLRRVQWTRGGAAATPARCRRYGSHSQKRKMQKSRSNVPSERRKLQGLRSEAWRGDLGGAIG